MNVRKKVPPSLLPTQSITSGLSAEEQLLGLAKMSAKKGASAFRKRIKRLLAENHSSAKLYQIAGTIEASYGSREQALCHFKIAKSLNPVDSTIHRDLGTLPQNRWRCSPNWLLANFQKRSLYKAQNFATLWNCLCKWDFLPE